MEMEEMMKMLMMKKMGKEEQMDPNEIRAKIEVLKELLDMSSEEAGKGVAEGMQKLTVMAPDKEGLMEGMDKAEDVVEDSHMMEDGSMMEDSEMSEMEYEDEEDDEETRKGRGRY